MGMGGGSSGGGGSAPANTTQTVTQQLPSYVQPYAVEAMNRGSALSNSPYQQYSGQRIAPLTPEHNTALQTITNRATAGAPEMNASRSNLATTQSGGFMGSNPWLDQTYQRGVEGIKSAVAPSFGHMQAFGDNSGYQQAVGRGAADLATSLYGGNYEAERDRQIKGMALAPGLASQDYTDAQQLLAAGDIRRTSSQDDLNLQYGDWLRRQNYPYQQLDVLSNSIRGGMAGGGTTTSTSPNPYQPSMTANMLGGGLLGGGLAGMFGSQYAPLGAGAGALMPWLMG